MPDRTKGQQAVIAAGLIVVGAGVAWLSISLLVAIGIGRVIRRADLEEGTAEPSVDTGLEPLLGVVQPREPLPTS